MQTARAAAKSLSLSPQQERDAAYRTAFLRGHRISLRLTASGREIYSGPRYTAQECLDGRFAILDTQSTPTAGWVMPKGVYVTTARVGTEQTRAAAIRRLVSAQ